MDLRVTFPLFVLLALPLAASFEQTRDMVRRGEFQKAVDASSLDLKTAPRDFRIWTLQGIALQGLGRSKESLDAFRQALALNGTFLPALQGAAQLEYELRDPRCRQTLETLVKLRSDIPSAHAMLGALAFEEKDCGRAVLHYKQAGEAANLPVVVWQTGFCYFRLKDWSAAEERFTALLRLGDDARVRYNLGLIQLEAGRAAAAIESLKPLTGSNVPDADALSLLASAYETNKQTPDALAILRRALELYPRDERLYMDLAAICLEHRSLQLGAEILEAGARNVPRSARIQTMLGVLYSRAALHDKAETAFKAAEALEPGRAYGRVGLAVAMLEMNATEEAIGLLRDQSGKTPDNPRVMVTLAQALLQKNPTAAELKEAESLLTRAVALDKENARAYALLGKIYVQREEPAKAADSLQNAIRLDPNDRASSYQLMGLYRKLGRTAEATQLQAKVRSLLEAERTEETEAGRYRIVRAPDQRPAQ